MPGHGHGKYTQSDSAGDSIGTMQTADAYWGEVYGGVQHTLAPPGEYNYTACAAAMRPYVKLL